MHQKRYDVIRKYYQAILNNYSINIKFSILDTTKYRCGLGKLTMKRYEQVLQITNENKKNTTWLQYRI